MTRPKRKRNFIVAGNVRIPWYRSADGRTFIDPRRFNRPILARSDHDEALAEGKRLAIELNAWGSEMAPLTAAERAEWEDTKKRLAGCRHALSEVITAGLAALQRVPHAVPDIIEELLRSKAPQDLHGRYRRGLQKTLARFAQRFSGDIADIKTPHIEEYLETLQVGTRRRDNILDEIRHLFQFARLRGYLPDRISEARKVSHVHKRDGEISFFTVAEMRLILEHVVPEWMPYVVLACFAGIRSEELARGKDASRRKDPLRWEDFDWEEREIHVRSETSKVGRKRIIPIHDNAFAWLSDYRNAAGPVAPAGRPDREFGKGARLERAINRELGRAPRLRTEGAVQLHLEQIDPTPVPLLTSFAWRPNALRHSYGSYRATILLNLNQLADEMGNSVEMIHRHYRNPRPKSQARAWFNIFPPKSAENIISIRAIA